MFLAAFDQVHCDARSAAVFQGDGSVTDFPQFAVDITIVGLVGGCVFLPPSMVIGYAVKAAEREDRQEGREPAHAGKDSARWVTLAIGDSPKLLGTSHHECLDVLAPDAAEHVRDLPDGRVRLHGVEDAG